MDVPKVVTQALNAVDTAQVPDSLKWIAFAKAFDLVVRDERSSDDSATTAEAAPFERAAMAATPGRFAAIARDLEFPVEFVERLFDEHEGRLQFVGTLERLGPSKQAKVEGISLLLCAARQAGGYDEDGRTPDALVRVEIERHGLYDVTNYSKHLRRLRQLVNANGSGRAMTYKLKYEGRVRARELVRELLGLEL